MIIWDTLAPIVAGILVTQWRDKGGKREIAPTLMLHLFQTLLEQEIDLLRLANVQMSDSQYPKDLHDHSYELLKQDLTRLKKFPYPLLFFPGTHVTAKIP